MGIGLRLREERERLEMTQEQLGSVGGVLKRALIRYEKNERMPDAAFLSAIAAAGVDVLYVLTGQHSGGTAAAPAPISEGDQVLLDNFHAAPEQVQAGIKTALGAFADAPHQVSKRKKAA